MRLLLSDPAVRIIDIAEDNRLGRARLLARGLQFAVPYLLLCPFRIYAVLIDALDTISTLLHDAAASHRHVGITHHLVLRRFPILEEQEVKAPHLVRTVIRAVPRAHAAVVNHVVQALGAVHGGTDRTNQLTRRVLALHAGYRLKECSRIRPIALVVGIDAQPVHMPAPHHLLLADDWNVVLGLAGDDAVVASDARIQIDRHAPRVWLALVIKPREQT